tara:strand:- start:3291 stop:4319 length:1029 start_codon:yes stop_codon:yes gene_type:complete
MKIRLLFLLAFLFTLQSCDTDDILPALTLTSSSTEISEDQGLTTITATLNSELDQEIAIPISFSGTATLNEDYLSSGFNSASGINLIIPSGDSSGSLTISSIQDENIEDIETIIITVESQDELIVISSSITISILDDDSDSDGDGINDSDDDCPNEAGLPEYNGCSQPLLIINEVLYDPPSGIEGDANGDGTREAQEDEFIEFVNLGGTLDLSGYTVHDNAQERHVFPQGTIIPSGGVLVLFGGGSPTGAFGNAIVQTASAGILNMNNAGDFVTLYNTNGEVVLTFDIEPLSNNPNESYTRYPDLNLDPGDDGILFYQHAGIGEALGAFFSPGTRIDGTNFN